MTYEEQKKEIIKHACLNCEYENDCPCNAIDMRKLELLALAEGERRERERIEGIIEKFKTIQEGQAKYLGVIPSGQISAENLLAEIDKGGGMTGKCTGNLSSKNKWVLLSLG